MSTKSTESSNSEGSVKDCQKSKTKKTKKERDEERETKYKEKESCPYIAIASNVVEFLIERSVIKLIDGTKKEAPIV